MTIRPVEFNAVMQNTHDATTAKTHEDNKAALQQQNVAVEVKKSEQQAANSVMHKDDAGRHEYNYSEGGGDGTGYQGNRKKRDKTKKESDDGKVLVKGNHHSFDMKI